MKLAKFCPDRLEKARAALAKHNADAAAGFDEWLTAGCVGLGNRVSFLQFLQCRATRPVTQQVARTARNKLLATDIDPDIPLAAYELFFTHRHLLGLTSDQIRAMNEAIDGGDSAIVQSLFRESASVVQEDVDDLGMVFSRFINDANVPVLVKRPGN